MPEQPSQPEHFLRGFNAAQAFSEKGIAIEIGQREERRVTVDGEEIKAVVSILEHSSTGQRVEMDTDLVDNAIERDRRRGKDYTAPMGDRALAYTGGLLPAKSIMHVKDLLPTDGASKSDSKLDLDAVDPDRTLEPHEIAALREQATVENVEPVTDQERISLASELSGLVMKLGIDESFAKQIKDYVHIPDHPFPQNILKILADSSRVYGSELSKVRELVIGAVIDHPDDKWAQMLTNHVNNIYGLPTNIRQQIIHLMHSEGIPEKDIKDTLARGLSDLRLALGKLKNYLDDSKES